MGAHPLPIPPGRAHPPGGGGSPRPKKIPILERCPKNPPFNRSFSTPMDMQARARALAERERRRREGKYAGGVRPMKEYRGRCVDWCVEQMGVPVETLRWSMSPEYAGHEWDGTPDPMAKMMDSLDAGMNVGMESGTGLGKTFSLALTGLHFLAVWEDSLVITSAPKQDQLLEQVWMEIGRLWPRFERLFPGAEKLTGQIKMKPDEDDDRAWSMRAFVAGVGSSEKSTTKAQGFHRERMLIITEETPGMAPSTMVAFSETRTDDWNLQVSVGNPDSQLDELHKFCKEPGVVHIRASALDHPNVVTQRKIIPGAIGLKRLEERKQKLGVGSRLFNSRIRGISPPESEQALIKWEWCEGAARRWEHMRDVLTDEWVPAVGADVSDQAGGDGAALAWWLGPMLRDLEEVEVGEGSAVRDAGQFGALVATRCRASDPVVNERHVGIDGIGVGASAVNECWRQGFRVRRLIGSQGVKGEIDVWEEGWGDLDEEVGQVWGGEGEGGVKLASRVSMAEVFRNFRAAVWWRMREDLRMGRVGLPRSEKLFRELTAVDYKATNGVIAMEPKERVVEKLGRSPNLAEAVCYGNYVRPRVASQRFSKVDPGLVRVSDSRNFDTRGFVVRRQPSGLYGVQGR